MYNSIRSTLTALALASMIVIPAAAQTQSNSATQTQNTQDWNTPPAGTEQAQQGYRDGVEAAKLDRAAKRPIDPKVSHLYVHPPVKGAAKDQYRSSFEAGYNAAVQHGNSTM